MKKLTNKRRTEFEDEDVERKPEMRTRRPHRNLVRYWEDHLGNYDEVDEFYAN